MAMTWSRWPTGRIVDDPPDRDGEGGPFNYAVRLFVVAALWELAMAGAVSFSGAWFWRIHTPVATILAYYGVWFLTMLAVFVWGETRGGRIGRRRIHAAGLAAAILSLGIYAWLGPASRAFVFELAVLTGLSGSLYWLALYIAGAEGLGKGRGRWYNAWIGVVESGASLLSPPAAGAIIAALPGVAGYRWVFGGAMALLAVALATVWTTPDAPDRPLSRPTPPARRLPRDLQALAPALFLLGVRDGAIFFLPGLLLFVATGHALLLGTYAAVQAAIQTVAFWLMTRPRIDPNRFRIRQVALALAVLAALPLATLSVVPAIFLFGSLSSLVYPVYKVQLEGQALQAIQAASPRPPEQVALTSRKELWINGGRVTAFAVLWLIATTADHPAIALRWALASWTAVTVGMHGVSRLSPSSHAD